MLKRFFQLLSIFVGIILVILIYQSQTYREIPLNNKQMVKYDKYKVMITEKTTKEDILALCQAEEYGTVADIDYIIYASEELGHYLSECKEINYIEQLRETLYVSYRTLDNNGVTVSYGTDGFIELVKYNETKDEMVIINDREQILYRNFTKDPVSLELNEMIPPSFLT